MLFEASKISEGARSVQKSTWSGIMPLFAIVQGIEYSVNTSWKNAIWIALAIVLVQAIAGATVYYLLPDWETRGTFGDMFGAVNALFSGIALAGVVYAIILQHSELALQREELKLTRNELTRTAAAQEKSEKALAAQARAATVAARLSAANYLYEEANRTIKAITSWTENSPEAKRRLSAEATKAKLIRDIRALYEELGKVDGIA